METIVEHDDRHNVQFTNENIWQAVSTIMAETEEGEHDAKRNANNLITDTFIQSPVTTNTPRNKTNVPNEKRLSLNSLVETINDLIDWHFNQKSTILQIIIQKKMTPKVVQKSIKW